MTRAFVLHPDLGPNEDVQREPEARLEEAVGLAAALDLDIVGREIVVVKTPRAGWLFGAGKVDTLGEIIKAAEAELVIIDGAITPKQQQNLEKAWNVKILDRTGLILEIFGDRAHTREGALQVELAHLAYQRTRLVRSWTHLERQRGALGFVGGPGETQIEADRRMLDERIVKIRRQLDKTVRTRSLQRHARKRAPHPVVALVGYTNAGKSTLFNRMTGAKILARDMLFATLDPTMRAIETPGGRSVILSDTVGFISDLPTQLIAAFRATLEEVLEADLIVHVRDAAHEDSDAQAADVMATLADLGVEEDRLAGMITVFNKIDLMDDAARAALENRLAREPGAIALSALTGEGLDRLTDAISARLAAHDVVHRLRFGVSAGAAIAWIYRHGEVRERTDSDEGVELIVSAPEDAFQRLESKFSKQFEVLAV